MTLIAVHGSASRSLPAERGTVRLSIRFEGDDRATAVQQVAALHERLAAEAQILIRTGGATRWGSARVRAHEERRYSGDGPDSRAVQVADAEVHLRFRDFAALAEWSERVGSEPAVSVDGIEWALTDETRRRTEREVRIEAVHDARARAEAYAAAIGGTGVDLQALWEQGLRPSGGSGPELRWTAQTMSRSESASSIELSPDDIEVTATVSADFLVRDAVPSAGAPGPPS